MKYICTQCQFIFDEALGNPESFIEAFTKFENIPDFSCPSCQTGKYDFFQIEEKVIYFNSPENLTKVEKLFYPKIKKLNSEIEISFENFEEIKEFFRVESVSLHDESGENIDEIFFDENTKNKTAKFSLDYLDVYEIRIHLKNGMVFSLGRIVNV